MRTTSKSLYKIVYFLIYNKYIMRYNDFKIINEATLNIGDFAKRNPDYGVNLVDMIEQGLPIPIDNGETSVEIKNPENVASQMRDIWDGSDIATPGQVEQIKKIKIPTIDNTTITVGRIFKSPQIKGKEADYNIGDIGEIALAISVAARFLNVGESIELRDFLSVANNIKLSPVAGKQSLKLSLEDKIFHQTGKSDQLGVDIVVPARSAKSFTNFIKNLSASPKNVQGTISSSIVFANENVHIDTGIERTSKDKNVNRIEINAVGTEDQKGTKADLILNIDGERINLLSAKSGASQLGQASGKEWDKPLNFFKKVFGVDVSAYKEGWSNDQPKNLEVLREIYKDLIIPKIMKLTAGDSTQKEMTLVKQIASGLIYFSNDVNVETGEVQIIDIVKLSTVPGSPGYKLLRIDSSLSQALEKTDLIGSSTPNGLGVQVTGNLDGKNLLLFKARSYYSPAGKLTRTIIEGGPLLDTLAVVDKPESKLDDRIISYLKSRFDNKTLTPALANEIADIVNKLRNKDLKIVANSNIRYVSDAARKQLQKKQLDITTT